MNFDVFSIRLLCKCSHRWVHNVNADNQREPYRCPACKSNDSIKLDPPDVYFDKPFAAGYKIEPASYPAPPAPVVDWTCYLCSKKIDKTDKNYILGDTICGPCRKEHLK